MTNFDHELDEEVSGSPGGTKAWILKPMNLWYMFMVVVIIFGKDRIGLITMDKAIFYGFAGLLIPWTLSLVWTALFHKTAKVVWNGGHSTTIGRIEKIGNFSIIRLDGLRATQVEWQQNKGLLIAPSITVEKKGNSIVVHARCLPKKYFQLPRIVRNYIRMTGYKPPYVMGYISEEQYTDILDEGETPLTKKVPLGQIVSMIEDLNKENTFLSSLLGNELGTFEDLADMTNRVYNRLTKKEGIVDKIKKQAVDE